MLMTIYNAFWVLITTDRIFHNLVMPPPPPYVRDPGSASPLGSAESAWLGIRLWAGPGTSLAQPRIAAGDLSGKFGLLRSIWPVRNLVLRQLGQ